MLIVEAVSKRTGNTLSTKNKCTCTYTIDMARRRAIASKLCQLFKVVVKHALRSNFHFIGICQFALGYNFLVFINIPCLFFW